MSYLVTISGGILRETNKAYLFSDGGTGIECWLPKSQVDYIRPKEWKFMDPVEIDIPRWLVEKNNLEYEDGDSNLMDAIEAGAPF